MRQSARAQVSPWPADRRRDPSLFLETYMFTMTRACWAIFVATSAFAAAAQQQAPTEPPPRNEVASVPFRSISEDYEPYSDQKLIPWREANDNVGRIGGWREYAREARQPVSGGDPAGAAAAGAPARAASEAKDPHAGHGR